ncbi:MAG: class I SAM-dependent methyltransferase, partial [Anaerolineae bacterium]|nr:class I SAM-dependent methyltransferase [Anaerolineae bacterium]NIQ82932.1 class I SAM-dependent methyltransferase [Anaerolineae bacterium]
MPRYVDYAEYYDHDHVGGPMTEDIPFYIGYAEETGGPILELACGTGRVLIPIAEAGFKVHGLDLSEN